LPDAEGALGFGRALWRDLIPRTRARLYCSLGKRAGKEIATLLSAAYTLQGWPRNGPPRRRLYRCGRRGQ